MKAKDFVSVDRRRQRLGLKPIGWVVLAVGALVIAGGLAFGVSNIVRGGLSVRPAATSAEAGGADDAEEEVSRAVDTSAPVQAGMPDLGDSAVLVALREDFLAAWEWLFASTSPHNPADVDTYFAPLPEGVAAPVFAEGTGPAFYGRDSAESSVREWADNDVLPQLLAEGGEWQVFLLRSSVEEDLAVLEAVYEGGTCTVKLWNTTSGELYDENESPCMWYVAGMLYDAGARRWKIAGMRQYLDDPG
jgi:hypothetical protein